MEQSPWDTIDHMAGQEIFLPLAVPEGSLLCSQEPSTGPRPELVEPLTPSSFKINL
jgi:hypothetical protein